MAISFLLGSNSQSIERHYHQDRVHDEEEVEIFFLEVSKVRPIFKKYLIVTKCYRLLSPETGRPRTIQWCVNNNLLRTLFGQIFILLKYNRHCLMFVTMFFSIAFCMHSQCGLSSPLIHNSRVEDEVHCYWMKFESHQKRFFLYFSDNSFSFIVLLGFVQELVEQKLTVCRKRSLKGVSTSVPSIFRFFVVVWFNGKEV